MPSRRAVLTRPTVTVEKNAFTQDIPRYILEQLHLDEKPDLRDYLAKTIDTYTPQERLNIRINLINRLDSYATSNRPSPALPNGEAGVQALIWLSKALEPSEDDKESDEGANKGFNIKSPVPSGSGLNMENLTAERTFRGSRTLVGALQALSPDEFLRKAGGFRNSEEEIRLREAYKYIKSLDDPSASILPDWDEIREGNFGSLRLSPDERRRIGKMLESYRGTVGTRRPPITTTVKPSPPTPTPPAPISTSHSSGPAKGPATGPGHEMGDIVVVNATSTKDLGIAAAAIIANQTDLTFVFSEAPRTTFDKLPKLVFQTVPAKDVSRVPWWAWQHGILLFVGLKTFSKSVRTKLEKTVKAINMHGRYPKVIVMLTPAEQAGLSDVAKDKLESYVRGYPGITGSSF
jgi:hypothetical protein